MDGCVTLKLASGILDISKSSHFVRDGSGRAGRFVVVTPAYVFKAGTTNWPRLACLDGIDLVPDDARPHAACLQTGGASTAMVGRHLSTWQSLNSSHATFFSIPPPAAFITISKSPLNPKYYNLFNEYYYNYSFYIGSRFQTAAGSHTGASATICRTHTEKEF